MNKKGFTLVELLAVLVVLGLVVGITVPSVNGVMKSSRAKSEEAFIETIKDAMDIYISSSAKQLTYKTCTKNPEYSYAVVTESSGERDVLFQDVIDSSYKPINQGSLMNPGNDKKCTGNSKIVNKNGNDKLIIETPIYIYRTNNYVYFYKIAKVDFTVPGTTDSCFKYTIEDSTVDNYNLYISNLQNPGDFECL